MVRPTLLQHVVSTVLLILISLLIAPVTFTMCAVYWVFVSKRGSSLLKRDRPPTVLINGSHMSKCLALVRTFGKAGCNVIIVDEGLDGGLTATRHSRYVHQIRQVPKFLSKDAEYISSASQGSDSHYISSLVDIASREKVDLFVPCSRAESAIADSKAAKLMGLKTDWKCKAIMSSPDLTQELHDKSTFMSLLTSLALPCPEAYTVTSIDQAIKIIASHPVSRPLILKAASALDDVGRTDMTLYPIPGDDTACTKARKKLNHQSIRISEKEPFILQEFIDGDEYCTNALVVDNSLLAFACCHSSSLVMRYVPAARVVSDKAEKWTRDFLEAYGRARPHDPFTGHFALDFVHRNDGSLIPIECNPRVHTAVNLLSWSHSLASTYLSTLHECDDEKYHDNWTTLHIHPELVPRSWHGHVLITVTLPYLFPFLRRLNIHPSYNYAITKKELKCYYPYKDATWDDDDPWPFFALYHIQWPWALAKFLITRRTKRWSRLNVSTGTIFEC